MISYLALGDSYTIGEGVALFDSFPYRLCARLRSRGIDCLAPEIIAKTGWTTDELLLAIKNHLFLPHYNMVTLLVGVNNQYRGRQVIDFFSEFEELLNIAVEKANGNPGMVFVLSIPDWGQTPFGDDRDKAKISEEILQYNRAIRNCCDARNVAYFDITSWPIMSGKARELVTSDQLHPSPAEYERWASMVADHILRT